MTNDNPSHVRRRSSEQTRRPSTSETESLILTRTLSQDPNILENEPTFDPLDNKPSNAESTTSTTTWPESTRYLILLCALITSTSFGVTQVPLLYVFRLMTCDAYYENHPKVPLTQTETISSFFMSLVSPSFLPNPDDRCAIPAIESATALSISLLGAGTTIFGLVNVFWIGGLIKRIGVKPTLIIQVFFPALRLLIQTIGVEVWGAKGIIIIQASQAVNIIGGPLGYVLALNTFTTEVYPYEARTAALGRLNGAMMFGSAVGFLVGGLVADMFGIKAPFRLTFALFLISTIYVAVFLPHIPPAEQSGTVKTKEGWIKTYFGQLLVFAPRKFVLKDGSISTEYGASLLACAVFLGILATGYLATLLQLYATDVFGFGTKDNGYLIFIYSSLRGLFLTFAFPAIIATGRRWTMKKEEAAKKNDTDSERQPLLSTGAETVVPVQQTFTFDLIYTRFSLIADGLLTLLCSLVHEGRQMYLVAVILPFAAGTSAAAKGTILQMVGASASSAERTDALAGISLVENMARLSTSEFDLDLFNGSSKISVQGAVLIVLMCVC